VKKKQALKDLEDLLGIEPVWETQLHSKGDVVRRYANLTHEILIQKLDGAWNWGVYRIGDSGAVDAGWNGTLEDAQRAGMKCLRYFEKQERELA